MFSDVYRQKFLVFGEAIKGAKCGDFQIDTFRTQFARAGFLLSRQRPLPFVREERHEMRELHRRPVSELLFLRPGDETIQQRGVGFLCVFGLPAFMPQEL